MIKSVSLSKRKGILKLKGKVKWEGDSVKQKPYPIPEEDSFTPPQDDSAEIEYNTKKNKD